MNTQVTQKLLATVRARFDAHPHRHPGLAWSDVRSVLTGSPVALPSLLAMESTGGEPDVIDHDGRTGRVWFCDCSPESPAGRRSLCYDRPALDARKENKPAGCAVERAAEMGIALLTEEQYRRFCRLKQQAAERAVESITSGMVVGLGHGSTAIFASTAPTTPSSALLARPSPSAASTVPASWPTPPSTTTMKQSMI